MTYAIHSIMINPLTFKNYITWRFSFNKTLIWYCIKKMLNVTKVNKLYVSFFKEFDLNI